MVSVLAGLVALVVGDWECTYSQELWSASNLKAPCVVLRGARADQLAAAQRAWNLSPAQAGCVLEAFRPAALDAGLDGDARRQTALDGAASGWRRCVERWPGSEALWVGLLRAQSTAPDVHLLEQLDGGAALATRLLSAKYAPERDLAKVIVVQQPERLAELLGATNFQARFELALDALAVPGRTFTDAEWQALGQAVVPYALQAGWLQFAGEFWATLPPLAKAPLLAKPPDEMREHFQRPLLALALVLTGQPDEAKRVPLEVEAVDGGRDFGRERLLAVQNLVRFSLGGPRGDEWEAYLQAQTTGLPEEALGLVRAWAGAYAHNFDDDVREALKEASELPAAVRPARERALARLRTLALAPLESPDAGAEAALPTISPVFSERKGPWRGAAPVLVPLPQLRGFYPVRAERLGKKTVVVALSQRLDPTGEVSMGGYWLLLADDQRGPWLEVYLGFADHQPWHLNARSPVPLLDANEVLRLDVAEAAIDPASITFPPLRTSAPTTRPHVVLEAPLAKLRADSDGDGLPDVVEARMLLNPFNADTDGDGVSDADDLTPRLDDRLAPSTGSTTLNAFFEQRTRRAEPVALVIGPNAPKTLEAAVGTARPSQFDDVRFVEGSAAELAGLHSTSRLITLTASERAQASQRYGRFYPLSFDVRVSRDGRHGYLVWNEHWRGGSARIDQQPDGSWLVTLFSTWVS